MLLTSFCHGYLDKSLSLPGTKIPCIVKLEEHNLSVQDIISLDFPRIQEDFELLKVQVVGQRPLTGSELDKKRLPRFGVMGLARSTESLYAATWNGIYRLKLPNLDVTSFVTNPMINDPHGIAVCGDDIYTVATSLDTVVITNQDTGEIKDHFTIGKDLKVFRNPKLIEHDWRFISKQSRGAVGFWHFNHIVVEGDNILLTSRLCSCMVQVNIKTLEAKIRSICWDTPVMIHDGVPDGKGGYVFTSVDGKILPAGPADTHDTSLTSLESSVFRDHMNRDMVNQSIRLPQVLQRDINWCRGMALSDEYYYTTLEGRYDQERPYFKIAKVSKSSPHTVEEVEISYDLLDFPSELRYMTGFSLLLE